MKRLKNKTWRLIYPDKTESLMNYNPIEHERERILKWIEEIVPFAELDKERWSELINQLKQIVGDKDEN